MSINQIYTTNTFAQWLTVTQALVEKYNYYEDRTNLVFDTANSTINVYNNTVSVYGNTTNVYGNTVNVYIDTTNVYSNTVNVYNKTISDSSNIYSNTVNVYNNIQSYVASAYNTANTVLVISNNSYNTANLALVTANAALEATNTFFANVFNIQDETSNANTFYITLVPNTLGVPDDVYVSSTKLFYQPSTGKLTVNSLSVLQNVSATTANISGLIRVGSANVSGELTANTINVAETITAKDFNSLSDINYKKDVIVLENSLGVLEQIQGVQFKWLQDDKKSYGVIAQELEKILPELVSGTDRKTVNYLGLISFLIESVKELSKKISQIEKNINK